MADIVCPTGCDQSLPVVSFSDCNPQVNLSEIEYILLKNVGSAPIDDITDLSEWQSRISNSSSSPDAIRQLRCTGDMPLPTDNEITISGQRKIIVNRGNTVNADIDESNDLNHEAFRKMQCGGKMQVAFVTRSGHLFGGVKFIEANVKAGLLLARGESEVQKYQMVITWNNKIMPERSVWPLAGAIAEGEGNPCDGDVTLTFVSAVTDVDAGVTGTVDATHATQQFRFDSISPRTGTPNSMTVNVGGNEAIVIDFPGDYLGAGYCYTHTTGTVYNGVFTNGTVNH